MQRQCFMRPDRSVLRAVGSSVDRLWPTSIRGVSSATAGTSAHRTVRRRLRDDRARGDRAGRVLDPRDVQADRNASPLHPVTRLRPPQAPRAHRSPGCPERPILPTSQGYRGEAIRIAGTDMRCRQSGTMSIHRLNRSRARRIRRGQAHDGHVPRTPSRQGPAGMRSRTRPAREPCLQASTVFPRRPASYASVGPPRPRLAPLRVPQHGRSSHQYWHPRPEYRCRAPRCSHASPFRQHRIGPPRHHPTGADRALPPSVRWRSAHRQQPLRSRRRWARHPAPAPPGRRVSCHARRLGQRSWPPAARGQTIFERTPYRFYKLILLRRGLESVKVVMHFLFDTRVRIDRQHPFVARTSQASDSTQQLVPYRAKLAEYPKR